MGTNGQPCTVESIAQPLMIEWFQQVIERMRVESLNRVLIVSGRKDNDWHCVGRNRLKHTKSVHIGKLNIKQQKVGLVLFQGGYGGSAGFALSNDLDVIFAAEQDLEFIARRAFVIHDDGAQRGGAER